METDLQLKHDIEQVLGFDPDINAAHVDVRVDLSGVRTIAQDMMVKTLSKPERSDSEIAAAVRHTLEWNVHVPPTVRARVKDGSVTLEGQATRQSEREAAETSVQNLRGVVQVFNSISLKPQVCALDVSQSVAAALKRQAVSDASSIQVTTEGGQVTLRGSAASWRAIEDATAAAWAAPGVTQVIDHLTIVTRRMRSSSREHSFL